MFTATRGGADREPEAVRGLVRATAVGVFLGVARVAVALVDDALAPVALAGVLLAAAALAGAALAGAAATVRVWAAARLFAGRTAVALFGEETLPVAGAPRAGVLARRSMLRMVATVRTFVSLRCTRCLVNHAGQTSKV
ncbi:MAG: hypothetical protein KA217_03265 [Gammaproteobacteria bacterium]|nr:hypothetical protein [Gammaproteobacteria bacterium]